MENLKEHQKAKKLMEQLRERGKLNYSTDGRWYYRWKKPDGTWGRIVKTELQDLFNCYLDKMALEERSYETLQTMFEAWIKEKRRFKEAKPQTLDKYENDFNKFFGGSHIANMPLSELTDLQLEEYIKETLLEGEYSRKGWNNVKIPLKGTLKFAKKKKETTIVPLTFFDELCLSKRLFKETGKADSEKTFNSEEATLVMDYMRENPTIRNLGLLLCFYTGLRIGELATLKKADIKNGVLTVCRSEKHYKGENGKYVYVVEEPKTKNGRREIVLLPEAVEIANMIKRLNPFGEYLFSKIENGKGETWIHEHSFRKALYDVCDNTGLPHRSPHDIRRTFGSVCAKNNMPYAQLKTLMGHADYTTTMKYYVCNNNTSKENKEALERALYY